MIKKYFWIIFCILMLIGSTLFYYRYQEIEQYKKQLLVLDAKYKELAKIHDELTRQLNDMKNNPLAMEELIRRYGYVKPGEIKIRIEEDTLGKK